MVNKNKNIKTVFKKYYHWVIIIALGIGLTISIVTRPEPKSDTVKEYVLQKKVDSLNTIILQYPLEREIYKENIESLSESNAKLEEKLKKNEKKLSTISKKYEHIQDSISTFTTNNITNYFNTRYGSSR